MVGNVVNYLPGGVNYIDATGSYIVANENITVENFTYTTFFKLFVKYPLDMCSIYARHLVNLLMHVYSDGYIHDLFEPKGLRISFCIILWLIAAVYAIGLNKDISLKKRDSLLLFAACVPCFLQLFGAAEVRFFITIHFLLYFFVAFCVN